MPGEHKVEAWHLSSLDKLPHEVLVPWPLVLLPGAMALALVKGLLVGGVLGVLQRLPQRGKIDDPHFGVVEHVLQRNWPVMVGHHLDLVALDALYPVSELPSVGYRRGEAEIADVFGREDETLLPQHAPLRRADEMHLINDEILHVLHERVAREDHVSVHLRGHDEDARPRVDDHVAGEDANLVIAVQRAEFTVLLVAQGLDGRGVDGNPPLVERLLYGILCDEGLPAASGGAHDDREALLQEGDGLRVGRRYLEPRSRL